MNREYLYVSDNELVVSNEEGVMEKREASDNIHDILLLENALEAVQKKISDIENGNIVLNKKENNKPFVFLIPLILVPSVCAIISFFNGTPYFDMYNSLILSVGGMGAIVLYAVEKNNINEEYKKERNANYTLLGSAYSQKREIEEKLTKAKNESIIDNNNTYDYSYELREIINLDYNPIYEKVAAELNAAYKKGYEQDIKKRTLKK